MVEIHFRLSELGTVKLSLETAEKWKHLLRRSTGETNLAPDSVLAVRRGRVLRAEDLVDDNDRIEVFPALSGG